MSGFRISFKLLSGAGVGGSGGDNVQGNESWENWATDIIMVQWVVRDGWLVFAIVLH